jgi:hypothetical protein
MDTDLTTVVVHGASEMDALGSQWASLHWGREEAEPAFLANVEAARPEVKAAFGAVVLEDACPVGGLAGWVETTRLRTRFGPWQMFAPEVRALRLVDGGVVAGTDDAIAHLVRILRELLRDKAVDVVLFPLLRTDGAMFDALLQLGGSLQRGWSHPAGTRRVLHLPGSYDDFVSSLGRRTREAIRRTDKRVSREAGIRVATYDRVDDLDTMVRDIELVARHTYQRALGVDWFADTQERRGLLRLGLEHGWFRAYVLYADERPVAFHLYSTYRGRALWLAPGYDPDFAALGVGKYLFARSIEDLCGDPAMEVLDFGPGDSEFKRQLSNDSWTERGLQVYSRNLRGMTIRSIRSAVIGADTLARTGIEQAGATRRVRSFTRRRASKRMAPT